MPRRGRAASARPARLVGGQARRGPCPSAGPGGARVPSRRRAPAGG
ncbi:hypothetical protein [Nocardioides convexus]|nr:hypothetical protein [Nocardioides convexus]